MSGRVLIFCMFLFATCVTAGLWTYWELHTRPFRPLTDELGSRFPGSSPRVEGGKHGLHRETPSVLRIIMRVPFSPVQAEEQYQQRLREVLEVTRSISSIEAYEIYEIHFFQQLPELPPVLRTVRLRREAEEFFPESPSAAEDHNKTDRKDLRN